MWCSHLRRFSHVFAQPGQKGILTGSRCCIEVVCQRNKGDIAAASPHTSRRKHGQTYQRWSKSYLATVAAGVGLSLATYKLLNKPETLLAAEEEKAEQSDNAGADRTPGDSSTEGAEKAEDEIDWSKVSELPNHVPYVLIGGGTASLEAFKAIKTNEPKAKVLMITEENHPPYIRPLLSKNFFLDDDKELYKQQQYTSRRGPSSMYQYEGLYMEPKKLPYLENGGLGLLKGKKVTRIDPVKKTVTLDDGRKIGYDKCLIATGGRPKNLEVFENASQEVKDRVMLFRTYEDAVKLIGLAETSEAIAVIGGGFLGSELAVGCAYRGMENGTKIYQVYPEKGVFGRVLPDYLSDWTTKQLQKEGVTPVPMVEVLAATFEEGKVRLVLTNGEVLLVDQVVVAIGLEPNTELAKLAGLETDKELGGYVVNSELQARSGIWAAGDCACFYDPRLGRRRVEHYDHADLTGRQAGFNMSGDAKIFRYQSMFWSNLGDLVRYEAVGLVDSNLKTFATFLPPPQEEKTELIEGVEVETSPAAPEEFSVGVIFYLRNDCVVGIVLWNLDAYSGTPMRMDIAKQIVQNGAKHQNLIEVAKLFNIHVQPRPVTPQKDSQGSATDSDKNTAVDKPGQS